MTQRGVKAALKTTSALADCLCESEVETTTRQCLRRHAPHLHTVVRIN